MDQLSSTASLSANAARHPRGAPAGIVHLGLGNFHRAHLASYTDAAMRQAGGDWTITGIAGRSRQVVDALRDQELLYTVIETSPAGERFHVPAVHSDVFVAHDYPARVIDAIGSPTARVVSLTVTENGYTYTPATGALDLDDPGIRHDLADQAPPITVVGRLVRGLQRRARTHGAPVTVLSCDNLADNGRHTERLVREFIAHLPTHEQTDLLAWLTQNATFPSSMVDRIVPATTAAHRALVAQRCGYTDRAPVPAEPFSMWVMQDTFAAGRPLWEAGGAVFSSEVDRYEQLKMRLLNGTHSLIAYLGALSGAATIPDSVQDNRIEAAARAVLRHEYLPSITPPTSVDIDAYEESLFTRWRNTALGHRTAQVGSDGSVKLRQRIPQPAIGMLRGGDMPQYLALTVAGYLSCVAPLDGFDPGPHAHAMHDPAQPMLQLLARQSRDTHEFATRVLVHEHLLGEDLAGHPEFAHRVAELMNALQLHGTSAAIGEATTSASTTAPQQRTTS